MHEEKKNKKNIKYPEITTPPRSNRSHTYQSFPNPGYPQCCWPVHVHTAKEFSMCPSHHWQKKCKCFQIQLNSVIIIFYFCVCVSVKSLISHYVLASCVASISLLEVASSRATVSSATASVRTSGVYPTRIPLQEMWNISHLLSDLCI